MSSTVSFDRRTILLPLVEAVYFVDKKYRAPPIKFQLVLSRLDDVAQFGDARQCRVDFDEFACRRVCDNFCERRFTGAGRSEKNQRRRLTLSDHLAECSA